MSRKDRDLVWQFYLGDATYAECMCCRETIIYRDESKGPHGWQSGHIIPDRSGYSGIYQNVNPICLQCNIFDKKYKTNYHYRVALGLMTKEEADRGEQQIRDYVAYIANHPYVEECIAIIPSNKNNKARKCTNHKLPGLVVCGIHRERCDEHTDSYVHRMVRIELVQIKARIKCLMDGKKTLSSNNDNDVNEILEIEQDMAAKYRSTLQ